MMQYVVAWAIGAAAVGLVIVACPAMIILASMLSGLFPCLLGAVVLGGLSGVCLWMVAELLFARRPRSLAHAGVVSASTMVVMGIWWGLLNVGKLTPAANPIDPKTDPILILKQYEQAF